MGGFDERRFVHPSIEDVELGARLVAAGGKIRLVPEAQGKHCKDWTLLQVWRTDILRRAYPWSCLLMAKIAIKDSNGDPIPFGLQEKEWRLLSPQVFATMVVLTNERGKVPETERFGVEQAEVVARDLANHSRSAAGCDIPEIGAGTTTTGGGGGLPVNVLVGAGGIAIIVIGGYTVWRRRPGRLGRVAPRVAQNVPEQCRGSATKNNLK